ncbi:MAG: HypC/HybG/HupF family hydrogenase formation chaperone [Haliea sp.]|jgi:hydrogenase expression/formation protein HypC|nr:HypC/HybG/HupF family hydrogenase formation chaperone [Haliea sp.]
MCLGVPLQVHSLLASDAALCGVSGEQPRAVDTSLLDGLPRVGDWLLVHVNIAVRALSGLEAQQIGDALLAVNAAASGQPFEHLLADLIDREPQLPDHLRPEPGGQDDNG